MPNNREWAGRLIPQYSRLALPLLGPRCGASAGRPPTNRGNCQRFSVRSSWTGRYFAPAKSPLRVLCIGSTAGMAPQYLFTLSHTRGGLLGLCARLGAVGFVQRPAKGAQIPGGHLGPGRKAVNDQARVARGAHDASLGSAAGRSG